MKSSLFCLAFLLISCGKSAASWREQDLIKIDNSRSLVEANLPVELWEKITGLMNSADAKKTEGGGHGGGGGGEAKSETLDSVFTPLKVYFIEKNRGILKQGSTEIELGPGGGEVDLADYLSSKNGTFYFTVDFLKDVEKLERKVYFLSNGRERKVENTKLGAGCKAYFDISSAFKKTNAADGFMVNTSDARQVSALAGTYFFAAVSEGKLHLAALTIKDSRYPKLHCR